MTDGKFKKRSKLKWTNRKLFNKIIEKLGEGGKLPDILEYSRPDLEEVVINSHEFDCLGRLNFGVVEGIHVRVYLMSNFMRPYTEIIELGMFKTLRNDKESWDVMGKLMTDFQWECMRFIQEHIDEFEEEE